MEISLTPKRNEKEEEKKEKAKGSAVIYVTVGLTERSFTPSRDASPQTKIHGPLRWDHLPLSSHDARRTPTANNNAWTMTYWGGGGSA